MKLLSLFSGIGAFEKALENLKIPYELVNYCEIDKYASKAYSLIHNVSENMNLGDITKIDTSKLPKDIDLITYGFPCVPRGYKVKTELGYKNIEDVTTQDKVLTHTNTYQKVIATMNRYSNHINIIKGVGCYDLQLTDEHPIYVYKNGKFYWVKTKDLTTKDNLVYNINQNSNKVDYTNDELWLLGRYCSDGYCENHSLHRPIYCIGSHKIEEFEKHLNNIKYSVLHKERSCVEYKILSERITELLKDFGTGSFKKTIPNWVVDLPKNQLKYFLDGYLSGDGHNRKDRVLTTFCTINEKMVLTLQEIIIKIYNVVPTISLRVDNRKETFNNTYNAQFSLKPKNQIIVNDKIIVPIKSIERIEKQIEVFNIEVKNDNSYTVGNVIVHNCQDISLAGKQKGMFNEDGSKTRSGLFFEALRIIEATKPKVCIAENVKNLVSKKFSDQFQIVLQSLEKIGGGYNNYYKVLNAKDYGIPQNRERVFIVSIRKDIDNGKFEFPTPFKLDLRLKDMLEDEVDEKYFLSETLMNYMTGVSRKNKDSTLDRNKRFMSSLKNTNQNGIATTITTKAGQRPSDNFIIEELPEDTDKLIQVGNLLGGKWDKINESCRRVYDSDGLSPTIHTCQGGNTEPKIIIRENTKKGYTEAHEGDGVYIDRPHQKRGVVQKGMIQTIKCSGNDIGVVVLGNYSPSKHNASRVVDSKGLAPTVMENHGTVTATVVKDISNLRIRKLTPKECFRLMGFEDKDIDCLIDNKISNTQLYKMAGNSIVVNVLIEIFKKLYTDILERKQLTIYDFI